MRGEVDGRPVVDLAEVGGDLLNWEVGGIVRPWWLDAF